MTLPRPITYPEVSNANLNFCEYNLNRTANERKNTRMSRMQPTTPSSEAVGEKIVRLDYEWMKDPP